MLSFAESAREEVDSLWLHRPSIILSLLPLLTFTHTSHQTRLLFYEVVKIELVTAPTWGPWSSKLNIKWNYKYCRHISCRCESEMGALVAMKKWFEFRKSGRPTAFFLPRKVHQQNLIRRSWQIATYVPTLWMMGFILTLTHTSCWWMSHKQNWQCCKIWKKLRREWIKSFQMNLNRE